VFHPTALLADSTAVVPRRPVHQRAEKVRHGSQDKYVHRLGHPRYARPRRGTCTGTVI
jgi:hypothetical protein